jgi:GAF domain-containing protein
MSEERKTLHQRIVEHLKRHEQSRAELADLKARAKDLDRKLDVRRKIIMGAAVQAHAKLDSAFREELRKAILAAVTRPHDRAILPEYFPNAPIAPVPPPASPARPLKAPEEPPSGAAPA